MFRGKNNLFITLLKQMFFKCKSLTTNNLIDLLGCDINFVMPAQHSIYCLKFEYLNGFIDATIELKYSNNERRLSVKT